MCVTCGCSGHNETTITNPQTGEKMTLNKHHSHTHTLPDGNVINHTHFHDYTPENYDHETTEFHAKTHRTTISLEQAILQKNDMIAAQNRGGFKGRNIFAINLVSSPGSGKTTLLTLSLIHI